MFRAMLTVACVLTLSVATALGAEPAAKPAEKEKKAPIRAPGWKLAVQAYSFNRYSFFEAIDKAKELGLKYIEAYPGQKLSKDDSTKWDHNASAEVREKVKAKLKEAGVKLVNYGVVDLGTTEESAKKVFDFAKDMGIKTIVAEPKAEAFDVLDKLTKEYGINVAIHNHPKPSQYWSPETVLEAVKGHSKRIGSCADTGHWPRSGVNSLEGLKKLQGHIVSLHFKDLNEEDRKGHDVPWGTGKCNAKGMLEELKKQGFGGVFSIEYEHNWESSMPEIKKCVEWFHATAKELGVKSQ